MPTILLAQEDAEARENFSALILDFFPTAKIQPVETWSELEPALEGSASVLLTDILWEENDFSEPLILLAEKYPEISFAIFGRYDLTGSLPPGYPIPLLAPDEELPLRLAEIMENFSGREFGSYRLSTPAGPHPLGRLYWAKHHQLERSVQILVPPAGSPVFPKAIRALARVNHPAVYSLYESVPWENRILVALEPVPHPSLLHLRLAGQKPSLLSCARLATALGSVLAEMESSAIPARRLGEYDYTLSSKGTPRLRNPAVYPGQTEASAFENAQLLAGFLQPFLQGQPKAASLFRILQNPGTSAFDLLRQTRDFERQLAEVREVHVRKEELEAAAKTLRARVIRRWAIGMGTAALAFFIWLFPVLLSQNRILVPGVVDGQDRRVPAGEVVLRGLTVSVPSFSLDQFETTVGEYAAFLDQLRLDPAALPRLLPPRSSKKNWQELIPSEWLNREIQDPLTRFLSRYVVQRDLLSEARRQGVFQKTRITLDSPVSGVDYDGAYAYAKWRNRRLPTEAEWIRAALGDDGRTYPWGPEPETFRANLGVAWDSREETDSGDGFFRSAPGPDPAFSADVGPFGHRHLAGNVSEWVEARGRPAVMGGNFADSRLIPSAQARRQDERGTDVPPSTRHESIGFRTAR